MNTGFIKNNDKKTIGIIAAMDVEVSALREALVHAGSCEIAGTTFYYGEIGGCNAVLMRCGEGKVSAAAGAQAMILAFEPDYVINTGCAGGLGKGLKIGDIVLSTACAEWDMDTTVLGAPRGYIYALERVFMEADAELRRMIRKATPAEEHVLEGLVVSGDQFISTDAQREIILGNFPETLCAEMEGAAIAHVCVQNKVPFCVIRAMSDTADSDSEVNFPVFAAAAGEKSAKVLIRMMENA
ncbi:MAG: 5'-methylthioadenosine/adenosylhomocysteine nucleosidase [Eubacteriales bacterium]|nr:5'-methylthioadenosine/adenosylhomocysteine nucleosidase [Eubacteriales bacterium]